MILPICPFAHLYIFYEYFIKFKKYSTELNLFLSFRLPWDQTTLLGYFFEMNIAVIGSAAYIITSGVFFILFASICLHHRAFYHIFEHFIFKIEQKPNQKEHFCRLIQFHISTKE